MDKLADVTMGLNVGVMKEPRGFIKVLQFLLAIFAFATTCGPSSSSTFSVKCGGETKTQTVEYSYPYNLKNEYFMVPACANASIPREEYHLCCDLKSAPQFYVFVGVMAFLYSMAALILYIKFDDMYRGNDLVPIVDVVVTVAFTAFFLIASIAWAVGLDKLKYHVNPETWFYAHHVPECTDYPEDKFECSADDGGNFATLNISIIFGFLCTFVWGGNLWFLYKETRWFRDSPIPSPQAQTPQFSPPAVPSPDQGQI